MTRGDRRAAARATETQPLLWNVAGLLGEGAGAVRDYVFEDVSIDLGDDLPQAVDIADVGDVGDEVVPPATHRVASTGQGVGVAAQPDDAVTAFGQLTGHEQPQATGRPGDEGHGGGGSDIGS